MPRKMKTNCPIFQEMAGEISAEHLAQVAVLYNLGTPIVATTDRIVASVAMGNKAYTIAAQPVVARNITVTRTAVDAADTPGIITVTGTNNGGWGISEVIIPGATGVTVAGTKAFKTVTSVVGSGWTIGGGADTIVVGVGTKLGLPYKARATANVMLGILGTAIAAVNAAVTTPATLEGSTIDMSAGTYDGSKAAQVFMKH